MAPLLCPSASMLTLQRLRVCLECVGWFSPEFLGLVGANGIAIVFKMFMFIHFDNETILRIRPH